MTGQLAYWQALNKALDAEMEFDDSVMVLGEDVGLYGGTYRVTEGLYAKFGEWRVRDTPISENSFTGLAVGAAMLDLRPVVEIMTINFALLALDSIINMAAKIPLMSGGQFKIPLVIRMPGGVAKQLAAQHSQRLEHTLMNVPGLRIAAPAFPQDAYWQLRQAIVSDDPIILLEHELLYFTKGMIREKHLPMHRARVCREGKDITIVAYSRMVLLALEAAEHLAAESIDADVIDLRSLKPIDWETIGDSVKKTHNVIVVEEDCLFHGAGAEIAATLSHDFFYFLDAPVERVAALDIPTPYNAKLESESIPDTDKIISAAQKILERS